MSREVLKNNLSDSLSASCLSGDTTISVTTGSKFPSTGDFRILVESEIMLVTARSSNTLTVTRGVEGTTAAAHGGGAVVTHILTAGAMQRYGRDNDPGFDGGRPPFRLLAADGSFIDSGDFTVVNASTSTIVDDASGSITLRKATQSNVEDVTAIVRTAPSTPNSLIAAISTCWPIAHAAGAIPSAGIGFRQSSSGKLFFVALNGPYTDFNSLAVYKYTSPTVISSNPLTRGTCLSRDRYVWFKATDDGTNLKFYVSHDAVNWIQLYTEARTTFMTGGPDQFMFGANNYNNGSFETLTTLEAWQEG